MDEIIQNSTYVCASFVLIVITVGIIIFIKSGWAHWYSNSYPRILLFIRENMNNLFSLAKMLEFLHAYAYFIHILKSQDWRYNDYSVIYLRSLDLEMEERNTTSRFRNVFRI